MVQKFQNEPRTKNTAVNVLFLTGASFCVASLTVSRIHGWIPRTSPNSPTATCKRSGLWTLSGILTIVEFPCLTLRWGVETNSDMTYAFLHMIKGHVSPDILIAISSTFFCSCVLYSHLYTYRVVNLSVINFGCLHVPKHDTLNHTNHTLFMAVTFVASVRDEVCDISVRISPGTRQHISIE